MGTRTKRRIFPEAEHIKTQPGNPQVAVRFDPDELERLDCLVYFNPGIWRNRSELVRDIVTRVTAGVSEDFLADYRRRINERQDVQAVKKGHRVR